jgi:hypothetical protein
MMRTNTESKSWFYILLTSYGELYSDDFMLPTGNLRERCKRANIIIVTKCPANLSATERNSIKTGWKLREIKSCILQILSLMNLFQKKS